MSSVLSCDQDYKSQLQYFLDKYTQDKYVRNQFTRQAWKILESFDCKINKAWEVWGYDGADEFGPKSQLWDLYILVNQNVHYYHREYWYYGVDDEEYSLYNIQLKSDWRNSINHKKSITAFANNSSELYKLDFILKPMAISYS